MIYVYRFFWSLALRFDFLSIIETNSRFLLFACLSLLTLISQKMVISLSNLLNKKSTY